MTQLTANAYLQIKRDWGHVMFVPPLAEVVIPYDHANPPGVVIEAVTS